MEGAEPARRLLRSPDLSALLLCPCPLPVSVRLCLWSVVWLRSVVYLSSSLQSVFQGRLRLWRHYQLWWWLHVWCRLHVWLSTNQQWSVQLLGSWSVWWRLHVWSGLQLRIPIEERGGSGQSADGVCVCEPSAAAVLAVAVCWVAMSGSCAELAGWLCALGGSLAVLCCAVLCVVVR